MGRYDISLEDRPILFEGSDEKRSNKMWHIFARIIELVASTSNTLNKSNIIEGVISGAQKAGLKIATLILPVMARKELQEQGISHEINTEKKSYESILSDGIDRYNKTHEQQAYWQQDEEFLSVEQYVSHINTPITQEQEARFIAQCSIQGLTPEQNDEELRKIKKLQLTKQPAIRSLLTLMYSGRYTTEAETLLSTILPKSVVELISKARDTMPARQLEKYEAFRGYIEERYKQLGKTKPFSTSEIFEVLLEENDGNIQSALLDLCEFYKYAARNMQDTDEEQPYDEMATWMQTYIADEYSTHASYTDMDISQHHDVLLNRVGLPYHFAYSTYLLSLLPAEAVVMLVTGEYLMYFNGHGATKAMADILFLKELDKIEEMLMSHQKSIKK